MLFDEIECPWLNSDDNEENNDEDDAGMTEFFMAVDEGAKLTFISGNNSPFPNGL